MGKLRHPRSPQRPFSFQLAPAPGRPRVPAPATRLAQAAPRASPRRAAVAAANWLGVPGPSARACPPPDGWRGNGRPSGPPCRLPGPPSAPPHAPAPRQRAAGPAEPEVEEPTLAVQGAEGALFLRPRRPIFTSAPHSHRSPQAPQWRALPQQGLRRPARPSGRDLEQHREGEVGSPILVRGHTKDHLDIIYGVHTVCQAPFGPHLH